MIRRLPPDHAGKAAARFDHGPKPNCAPASDGLQRRCAPDFFSLPRRQAPPFIPATQWGYALLIGTAAKSRQESFLPSRGFLPAGKSRSWRVGGPPRRSAPCRFEHGPERGFHLHVVGGSRACTAVRQGILKAKCSHCRLGAGFFQRANNASGILILKRAHLAQAAASRVAPVDARIPPDEAHDSGGPPFDRRPRETREKAGFSPE